MGDVAFVIIRRREGLFQTVLVNEDVDFSIHDLKEGMTVRVKGVVNKEERAPHGRELHIREIQVLSSPAEPLPLAIDKWKLNTSLEAKLNYRSLSLRNIQERARFKIQEALTRLFVIISMKMDLRKSIRRRSEPEVLREARTCLNSAISINRLFWLRAHSFTNR